MTVQMQFRGLPLDGLPAAGQTYEGVVMTSGAAIGKCTINDGLFVAYVGPSQQFVGSNPKEVEAAIEEYLETVDAS